MMPPEELKALGEDIKENWLRTNIAVWQADEGRPWFLLDGRNRLDAAELVGLSVKFIKQRGDVTVQIGNHIWAVDDVTSIDPYEWVISANVHRRHLTPEQKRDLIAKLLKAQPEKSNRTIAKETKTDHKTVGAVREKLEAAGEIPHHYVREDARGTMQPAHKPTSACSDSPPARGGAAVLFGERPMSKTEAKKLERQNAELEAKELYEQVGAFHHELIGFINDNYCPRLIAWCEAHPQLDDEGKGGLINALESCSMTLQQLAQKIDGRGPDDNEAAQAPAAPPVGNELDIPPDLKRT
ncbi:MULTISPECIES: ParB/Srx family N-terminal domain-containing protein [unclassified Bradyrhizobium]|uniref:ParB/Srx family N-terminal domain-containing protein n=1 Tax=unclassified Bradyrhizobium TaxID=2631580 RepID=UPI00339A697A